MSVVHVDLGPVDAFDRFPAPVDVAGERYFLVRDGHAYHLLSSVCPHQGGAVAPAGDVFECAQHGWQFDLTHGRCVSGPSSMLARVPVQVEHGRLVAQLATGAPAVRSATATRRTRADWPKDLQIRLVGHASLSIAHKGFTLLTDPWLEGPAYLGAWITYPDSGVDLNALAPDAIWISHEHSDHFHPTSLARFDRRTPVYVPDFPNERLPRALAALGFERVVRMQFGRAYEVAPSLRLTCFEPPGLWNDAIVLIEVGDLKLLNINDAGINHRIASLVGEVDVLASGFAPASSFPYAWDHVSTEERATIAERARVGMLRMLHQAVKRYQPQTLLPFASFFTLWHPSHRQYAKEFRKNTLDDVVRAFRSTPIELADMLPGGSWEPASGQLHRGLPRETLYSWPVVERWLDERFDRAEFERHHPAPGPLHRDDVHAYFQRLNDVPDIAFCDDLTVNLHATEGGTVALESAFRVANGRLDTLGQLAPHANLDITLPLNVLRHLVTTDASWDEAHVGFWCRFSRTPDVYSAGFWRLLQAPYYLKSSRDSAMAPADVAAHSNVASLLERFGDPAARILSRYGLHCVACPHASAETVALAAERHGVDGEQIKRMLRELNMVLADARELQPQG